MTGFLTQRAWAERLGVSIRTFRRWRQAGHIPTPDCSVPGIPRWSLGLVAKTSLVVKVQKRGLFQARGTQRGFQSASARFQQGQRPQDGAVITGEGGLDVHAATVSGRERAEKINSVEGAR